MADKMNIRFRLTAVDKFSKTMGRLERKLAALQAQTDALNLRHHGSITMDVDKAHEGLDAIRDKYQTIHQDFDRALKPIVDTRDAYDDLDELGDRTKDRHKDESDLDGVDGGDRGGGGGRGGRDRDRGRDDDDDGDIDIGRIKNIDLAREAAYKEERARIKRLDKDRERAAKKALADMDKMMSQAQSMNKKMDRVKEALATKAARAELSRLKEFDKANKRVTANVRKDMEKLDRQVIRMTINNEPAMEKFDQIRRELNHIERTAENFVVLADARQAIDEMDDLKRRIDHLDRSPVPITAEAAAALREVDSVKKSLDSIKRKVVRLDIDEHKFLREINKAQRMLEYLESQEPTVEVEADITAARAQMQHIIETAHRVGALDPSVRVDVDGYANAMRRLEAIDRAANKVERNSVIRIFVAGYSSFRKQMDRIATTGRNIGEITGNMFMGTALAFSSTLVPIIASTVGSLASLGVAIGVTSGAVMGLSSSLVAAGSGLGLYAAVAIPALSKVTEAAGDMRDMQEKIDEAVAMGDHDKANKLLDEMAYALSELSAEQRGAVTALNEFKDAHEALVQKFEGKIFETFALGLTTVTEFLERSEGIIGSVADAVHGLVESFSANLNSKDFNEFFSFLETHAAPALTTIVKGLGNFVMGFLNMMEAFGPLSVEMQNGFLGMSETFRKWAAALSESDKFRQFTEYVSENWPKVRAIIGKAITGIITLFAQFAPYAAEWNDRVIGMMDSFIAFGSSLGSNPEFQNFMNYMSQAMPKVNAFIGSFVDAVIAIGKALAPVGLVMLDVGVYLFDMITNFQKANPEFSTLVGWIGTLSAGFFAVLPLIVIVRTAFTVLFNLLTKGVGVLGGFARMFGGIPGLLIGGFMLMWSKSEEFRDIVTGAFNSVKENVSAAVEAVVGFVSEQWDKLTAYWEEHGETIKTATRNVWNIIETVVNTTLKAVLAVFKFVWPVIKAIVVSVWDAIKLVVSGALDIILGLVSVFSGVFAGDWSAVWDGIKQIFTGAFKAIMGIVSLHLFGRLLRGVGGFAAAFGGSLKSMWTSITTGATNAVGGLRTKIVNGFTSIRTGADNIVTALVTRTRTLFSDLVTRSKQIWDDLVTSITTKLTAFRTGVENIINSVKEFFRNAFGNIKSIVTDIVERLVAAVLGKITSMAEGFGEAIGSIKDWFVDTFNGIFDFLGSINLGSIGSNIIKGLTGGLTSGKGGLFSTMGGIASSLIGNTEKDFDVRSPSRVFRTIGEMLMSGMAVGITNRQDSAVNAALNAAKAVEQAFTPEMALDPIKARGLANMLSNRYADVGASYAADAVGRSATARAQTSLPTMPAQQTASVGDPMQYVTIEVPVSIDGREVARATRRPLSELDSREASRHARFTSR